MAFNIPTNYQQIYYPQPAPQMPQQQQSCNITWVSGEAGAKSYLVAPNTTVQLWDSESQTIYLKSADASGMPTIKTLDYTIRDTQAPNPSVNVMEREETSYVTKDEFDDLKDELEQIKDKLYSEKENNKRFRG